MNRYVIQIFDGSGGDVFPVMGKDNAMWCVKQAIKRGVERIQVQQGEHMALFAKRVGYKMQYRAPQQ
jgi:hypothetical protein